MKQAAAHPPHKSGYIENKEKAGAFSCGTCKHLGEAGVCKSWDAKVDAQYGCCNTWENDSMTEFEAASIKQALSSSAGLVAEFRGPSGAAAADDEAFAAFAGLPRASGKAVREEILDSLQQPQGWSTDSITNRIVHYWVDAGFPADLASVRAETVARTEVRSIASEFKRRTWRTEEAERQQTFTYRIRGADDHRTTKLSRWTRQQVPPKGLPLDEMERMLDEGVRRAIAGEFTEHGQQSAVEGRPILLPPGFRRRGFLIHFNDRDQVFRVA